MKKRSAPPAAPEAALGGAEWLTGLIVRSAGELLAAGRARHAFDVAVHEALLSNPVQAWEADRWFRGIRLRLVKMESFFFRAGVGKKGATSLFVRNPDGLNVGLRREAITQTATFVSLITDFGYGRSRTRFETGRMDVAVYDDAGSTWIYAENKASARMVEKLCGRLEGGFVAGVPLIPDEDSGIRVEDAVMKANHIWRHRPVYFWGVSPTVRKAYAVDYNRTGFSLRPVESMPTVDELPTPASLF